MPGVVILIPAAGASRRMGGRDKLMEPVGAEPALTRAARLAAGTACRVIVTLPASGPFAEARRAAVAGTRAEVVAVSGAEEGMAASLRAGAAAAGDARGLMILMPDMPGIAGEDLSRLLAEFAAHPDAPLRATALDGAPGHPVILPRRLFPAVARLTGDRGARAVLEDEKVRLIPLPGSRATLDLDTPQDWESWRAGF